MKMVKLLLFLISCFPLLFLIIDFSYKLNTNTSNAGGSRSYICIQLISFSFVFQNFQLSNLTITHFQQLYSSSLFGRFSLAFKYEKPSACRFCCCCKQHISSTDFWFASQPKVDRLMMMIIIVMPDRST